jgi:hypothetical protein
MRRDFLCAVLAVAPMPGCNVLYESDWEPRDAGTDSERFDANSGIGDAPATACTGSQQLCGSTCHDLAIDRNHCGACGTACLAWQSCVTRSCTSVLPAQLNTRRSHFAVATAENGRVYVWGGYNLSYLNSTEMYDPIANVWTARSPLPITASGLVGVALTNGKVLSIGGGKRSGGCKELLGRLPLAA